MIAFHPFLQMKQLDFGELMPLSQDHRASDTNKAQLQFHMNPASKSFAS